MRVLVLSAVLLFSFAAFGQTNVGVELDEVVDNRVTAGPFVGSLDLRLKLTGSGLDRAAAARINVKEARDDRGNVLSGGSRMSDFTPREYNMGTLQCSLATPARAASSVRVKGTVELFVPARDPSATMKIDKAFANLDKPLASKTLKAAKMEITPLSSAGYVALMKSRKITEKDIEGIRAEGKKRGVPEKEIELAIELAKAFESIDTPPSDKAVILSGKKADFDRIYRVEILGADGNPINVTSRSTSTRGESSIMTLDPSEKPPANASLQIVLLTDKARMSVPFELSVPLP
jgi:hypothetical protein